MTLLILGLAFWPSQELDAPLNLSIEQDLTATRLELPLLYPRRASLVDQDDERGWALLQHNDAVFLLDIASGRILADWGVGFNQKCSGGLLGGGRVLTQCGSILSLVDLETGLETARLEGLGPFPQSLSVSPNDRYAALSLRTDGNLLGGESLHLKLIDLASMQIIQSVASRNPEITILGWVHDDTVLFADRASGNHRIVRLSATGEQEDLEIGVVAVRLSDDHRWLLLSQHHFSYAPSFPFTILHANTFEPVDIEGQLQIPGLDRQALSRPETRPFAMGVSSAVTPLTQHIPNPYFAQVVDNRMILYDYEGVLWLQRTAQGWRWPDNPWLLLADDEERRERYKPFWNPGTAAHREIAPTPGQMTALGLPEPTVFQSPSARTTRDMLVSPSARYIFFPAETRRDNPRFPVLVDMARGESHHLPLETKLYAFDSADDYALAVQDSELVMLHLDTLSPGPPIRTLAENEKVHIAQFNSTRDHVAFITFNENRAYTLSVYSLSDQTLQSSEGFLHGTRMNYHSLVWTPDGRLVFSARDHAYVADAENLSLHRIPNTRLTFIPVWNRAGNRIVHSLQNRDEESAVAQVFNVNTEETIELEGEGYFSFDAFAWRNDDQRLLASDRRGTLYVWDTEQATLLHRFQAHRDEFSQSAFIENTHYLYTRLWNQIRIWDQASGELVGLLVFYDSNEQQLVPIVINTEGDWFSREYALVDDLTVVKGTQWQSLTDWGTRAADTFEVIPLPGWRG